MERGRGDDESALADAAELIEHAGARSLAPALCEWRAELATVLGDRDRVGQRHVDCAERDQLDRHGRIIVSRRANFKAPAPTMSFGILALAIAILPLIGLGGLARPVGVASR